MSEGDKRWAFIVEACDAPDQLLRVLGPFVVIGAWPSAASLERSMRGVTIRVEAEALEAQRAETLRRRLQGLTGVTSVAMSWREAAPVQRIA